MASESDGIIAGLRSPKDKANLGMSGTSKGAQGKGVLDAQNFTAALCVYKVNPARSVTATGMRET